MTEKKPAKKKPTKKATKKVTAKKATAKKAAAKKTTAKAATKRTAKKAAGAKTTAKASANESTASSTTSERAVNQLHDLSPMAWEHPADRAALNALRKIPGFEAVLRKIVGLFGEKQIRLSLQANAVRVSPKQYPWVHERLMTVCDTLDVEEVPALFITQDATVQAFAVGFDHPFIVINSSLIEVLNQDEVEAVIAHEVGHIESGHAVYRTMLYILLMLGTLRYPLVSATTLPIRLALLEWQRKSELSGDRAALLAVQDPRIVMSALMKLAGGSRGEELDLDEFIAQSDDYRGPDDVLAGIYKFLAALGTTHPFTVVRVAELRDWIETGEYDEIVEGTYRTRAGEAEVPYTEDFGDAAGGYAGKARGVVDGVGSRVGSVGGKVADAWRKGA